MTAAPARRALAVVLLLAACTTGADQTEPAGPLQVTEVTTPSPEVTERAPSEAAPLPDRPRLGRLQVRLDKVADMTEPIAMAYRNDDNALYVAERGGRVRLLRDGKVRATVLDISDRTRAGGEQGLLGIDFTADGATLLVSYTDVGGDSHLDAFRMRGREADPSSRRELLFVEQPFANHNGGNVVVGPDGLAYLGLGDGGSGGDPQGNGQNPDTLLGKMVRLDPFAPDPRPEVYLLGLRNPWRFSFDRDSGRLWIGDVGQNSVEEISVVPAGERPGANLGWNLFEGAQPYEGGPEPDRYIPPLHTYPTSDGCAVTGGYVYRGRRIPDLRGAYLFADVCNGRVQALHARGGRVRDRVDLGQVAQPVSFGQDAAGELYVLSLAGGVYRLRP